MPRGQFGKDAVLTNWVRVVPAEQAIRTKAVLLTRRHRDEVLAGEMQTAVDNLWWRVPPILGQKPQILGADETQQARTGVLTL